MEPLMESVPSMDPPAPPQPPLADTTGAEHMTGAPDNFVSWIILASV